MALHSHPDLLLKEHIHQVSAAMEALMAWHSRAVITPHIRDAAQYIIRLHDAGKGNTAFQEYIASPESYRGDRQLKSHAQLSALFALLFAAKQDFSPSDALAIAAAAYGHHTSLPPLEALRDLGYDSNKLKRQCAIIEPTAVEEEISLPIGELSLAERPWSKTKKFLDNYVEPYIRALPLAEAVNLRLQAQLLFSLLLEADKALLAVKNPDDYLKRVRKEWSPEWVEKRIGSPAKTPINDLRMGARRAVLQNLQNGDHIFSLTAPTGVGKTLLAASWALENRKRLAIETGVAPKIIVVLPFLSIIDQTVQEYEKLLSFGEEKPEGDWFLTYHSLSDRQYRRHSQVFDLEEDSHESFFIDTWRTELVITTYDQFLLALMSPKARHQMRFHNLCDALIIIDEVQSLPCCLWKPLAGLLNALTKVGNSRVLLMSATLPPFVDNALPLLPGYQDLFRAFGRYKIKPRLAEKLTLEIFVQEINERIPDWLACNQRVLITLNTRRSARFIRDAIEQYLIKADSQTPLFFISADVTPRDRRAAIEQIKHGLPCLVMSTQCIEAGVDIDMDVVIRDFAPLDSIIQVAGRCNREGTRPRCEVEIIELCTENGRSYSSFIYEEIHLNHTRSILAGIDELKEEDIFNPSDSYFLALSQNKRLGEEHLEHLARWQEGEPVRTLLRGEEKEQHTFLVIEQDPLLEQKLEAAYSIENHWRRREALRQLAGRIAKCSVSVFAKRGFEPQKIADNCCGQWLLRPGYYDSSRGLDLDAASESSTGFMIL